MKWCFKRQCGLLGTIWVQQGLQIIKPKAFPHFRSLFQDSWPHLTLGPVVLRKHMTFICRKIILQQLLDDLHPCRVTLREVIILPWKICPGGSKPRLLGTSCCKLSREEAARSKGAGVSFAAALVLLFSFFSLLALHSSTNYWIPPNFKLLTTK